MRLRTWLFLPILATAAVSGLFAAASPVRAGVAYVFKDIDVPGSKAGTTSVAAIDNLDRIVGWYEDAKGVSHGYVYANGKYAPFNVPGATSTQLSGVNERGQIVGTYVRGGTPYGFLDTFGVIRKLVDPRVPTFTPLGINDRGQVLGGACQGSHACGPHLLYSGGVFTDVTADGGGDSSLSGLNNRGQFVGSFYGMLYRYGFIVGNDAGSTEIVYPNERWGTLAFGMNDLDQVVGLYKTTDGSMAMPQSHGFLYTSGAYFTVDARGAAQSVLTGIDDRGDLIGYAGSWPDPQDGRPFLAIRDPAAPEASTWAMMAVGFAGLGLMGLRSFRRGPAHAG